MSTPNAFKSNGVYPAFQSSDGPPYILEVFDVGQNIPVSALLSAVLGEKTN
jgi:hypothetical protein